MTTANPSAVADATVPSPAGPGRCPRHAKRAESCPSAAARARIGLADLCQEPFRLFFPLGVLAGLIGIALWPLMLGGWMEEYPGTRHARLMIEGFFGAFIFGFLGTSMPRLIETRPLSAWEVITQAALHLGAVACYTLGSIQWGDLCFVGSLAAGLLAIARRFPARQDLPPPGFVLMPMAFACLVTALGIEWIGRTHELPQSAELLSRLLGYHAFILLCILGAGSFLLPRFLGLGVRKKFATMRTPDRAWLMETTKAIATGALVVSSYFGEALGWPAAATSIRVVVIGLYLWSTMPFERLRWSWNGVQWLLVVGLVSLPVGILAAGLWPGWRVALSHIELISGFGLITLGVATRVVFGHSGHRPKLERFHLGITVAAILMLLGMLSRITGDLMPDIMVRHYIYGAVCWGLGLLLWGICILPKILTPDPEG